MRDRYREWAAALSVLVLTAVAVGLDIGERSVRHFWLMHSFTASVVAGLLVLLLTVLVVDRVNRGRQLKGQSRAIGAQAAIIVAQAGRAADALAHSLASEGDRDDASQELRTYMQMLLTSAPILIEARTSRTFLEVAQQTAAQLYRALRVDVEQSAATNGPELNAQLERLHQAAAPLLQALNREQRAAASDEADPRES